MVPSMFSPPVRASGHEPKRPTRLPAKIKAAILLMVYGDPARPDEPIDFIAAAKLAGVAPDNMRRWLHRPGAASITRSASYFTAKPRAQYEAEALSNTRPWEALGISRSTWKRRGKPRLEPSPSAVTPAPTDGEPSPSANDGGYSNRAFRVS
jgi:hypothetical protein